MQLVIQSFGKKNYDVIIYTYRHFMFYYVQLKLYFFSVRSQPPYAQATCQSVNIL